MEGFGVRVLIRGPCTYTCAWFSGFRREVDESCAFLGCYAACSGDFFPTFRNKLGQESDKDSWTLKMLPIDCPETSVTNYHYSIRNSPEQRSSLTQYLTNISVFLSAFTKLLGWYFQVCRGAVLRGEYLTAHCLFRSCLITGTEAAQRRRANRMLRVGALLLLLEWLSVVISCDIVTVARGGGVLQALGSRAHHSRDLFSLPQYLPQW